MTHQGTNPAERFKFAAEENEKQCIRDTSNFQRTKALAYLGETPSASQSRDLWRLSARRNPNVVNFPLKSPPSYCSNSHAPCTNDATMKPCPNDAKAVPPDKKDAHFLPLQDDEFFRQQEAIWRQISDDKETQMAPRQLEISTARFSHYNPMQGVSTTAYTSTVSYSKQVVENERDDTFLQFLQDSDMIREQRRILELIQKGNQQQESQLQRQTNYKASCPSDRLRDMDVVVREACTLHHAISSSDSSSSQLIRRQPSLDSTSSIKTRKPNDGIVPVHHIDTVTKVGKCNLRIKGISHTYKSIAEGTAIIVQCPTCKAILQLTSSAKLLYCTNCSQVTPVELARATQSFDTSVDQQIARTMQHQELDVACALKLSKIA